MLLNSKGKFFNKVNLIDFLVIVLIIVAIIGAYFRFNGKNVVAEKEKCEFYYSMTVKSVRESNKNILEDSIDTSFRLDGKIKSSMGTLIDVEVKDAVTEIDTIDGNVSVTTIPGKYDVVLTFRVNGYKNNTGYLTPEMHEICSGKSYSVTNIYSMISGTVNRVWTE